MANNTTYSIYRIYCTVSGLSYVGMTGNVTEERFGKRNPIFQSGCAYLKYLADLGWS
jgi:hypothetical protein